MLKIIILPRQARDNHRESPLKRDAFFAGCLDTSCAGPHPIEFAAVKEAAKTADAVVLALGLCGRPKIFDHKERESVGIESQQQQQPQPQANTDGTEGEGHDRTSIALPDGQLALVDAVLAAVRPSTKVILVLFNGGGLAIEKLMANSQVHAIIEVKKCRCILLCILTSYWV